MSYSPEHILRNAKFSQKQIKAIVRVIEARTNGLLDNEDLETALAKLEVRILNRIYMAFAVQMGLLITLIVAV
ncbi:hypothetical protein [Gracilimonas sediminicola]|uniref:DUF1640 domain-containing protein n=1 Tax=Gracilimonas sediminicola TaxID=2952158 RepID=A0A9X2RDM1_9BACT|nr:hypothetical protein [Gracilimonas sediminicola]MCP9290547.1 hypothetical protein [Gracilimonas sediminicola]